jgi:hypothetical protein
MRKSARSQSLPKDEEDFLASLDGPALKLRTRRLYESGWTLSAIGAPINRSRSTIRFWVSNAPELTATTDRPVPIPEDRSYIHKKPTNPGIYPKDLSRIKTLAPLARKYRSRLSDDHPSTLANQDLTNIAQTLHASHVPIQEIADAAGVTYRAMYRRIHQR